MYREFFARSPLLALPIAALLIFLIVFASVLISVLRRKAQHFEGAAALPLQGGDDE